MPPAPNDHDDGGIELDPPEIITATVPHRVHRAVLANQSASRSAAGTGFRGSYSQESYSARERNRAGGAGEGHAARASTPPLPLQKRSLSNSSASGGSERPVKRVAASAASVDVDLTNIDQEEQRRAIEAFASKKADMQRLACPFCANLYPEDELHGHVMTEHPEVRIHTRRQILVSHVQHRAF